MKANHIIQHVKLGIQHIKIIFCMLQCTTRTQNFKRNLIYYNASLTIKYLGINNKHFQHLHGKNYKFLINGSRPKWFEFYTILMDGKTHNIKYVRSPQMDLQIFQSFNQDPSRGSRKKVYPHIYMGRQWSQNSQTKFEKEWRREVYRLVVKLLQS